MQERRELELRPATGSRKKSVELHTEIRDGLWVTTHQEPPGHVSWRGRGLQQPRPQGHMPFDPEAPPPNPLRQRCSCLVNAEFGSKNADRERLSDPDAAPRAGLRRSRAAVGPVRAQARPRGRAREAAEFRGGTAGPPRRRSPRFPALPSLRSPAARGGVPAGAGDCPAALKPRVGHAC